MVSNSRTPTRGARTGDRAQLILIAAIALAFIILSIVVVFNSVLYTQTMSSSSSIETTSDAQMAELEMARGIREIVQDVNLDPDTDNGGLEGYSEPFTRQYQNATAERRPAIVDVSIVDVDTEATAATSSVTTDEVFNSSSRSHGEVGHFVLRLDESFNGNVEVIANEDEDDVTIDGGGEDFDITDVNDESCLVTPTEGIVAFDFSTGTIFGSDDHDCEIKLIDPNKSYESLRVDSSEEVDYELVARGDDDLVEGGSGEHDAAWTVLLEYTYDTSELSVDREFEVEVYGDRR